MAKLIACAGQGIELSGVPTEIKILPLGRVHSQKGDFNVDEESFELIRKQFKDRKLDLVIDYEHQTLSDVQAPAGGWINKGTVQRRGCHHCKSGMDSQSRRVPEE